MLFINKQTNSERNECVRAIEHIVFRKLLLTCIPVCMLFAREWRWWGIIAVKHGAQH